MTNFKILIGAGVFALCASVVSAATVTVSAYTPGSLSAATKGWRSISQDFESLGGEHEVGSLATNVGTFSTLGGVGTGGTVKEKLSGAKNTGQNLAIRDDNVFGRHNVAPTTGKYFLDSNDTFGLSWDVHLADGKVFDKLIFALTDAADVGAFMRISVGGTVLTTLKGLQNGVTKLVMVDFGGAYSSAKIELGNYTKATGGAFKKNDGFSIDAIQVAAVPLPAGFLLLGSALVGFGAMARRRSAKA